MSEKNKDFKSKAGLKKEVRESQKDEMQSILQQTELPIINKFSDSNIDKENLKNKLLINGVERSWKELREAHYQYKRYIAAIKRDYEKTFPPEIYTEWRRLNGWDKNAYKPHQKPRIFAVYTKVYVYGRLPKEILPTLENLNDYLFPGASVRTFKHFELVTDQTYKDIVEFIHDVIRVAKSCKDMYEFKVKYAALYGKPFSKSVQQLDAFRDNDEIINSI